MLLLNLSVFLYPLLFTSPLPSPPPTLPGGQQDGGLAGAGATGRVCADEPVCGHLRPVDAGMGGWGEFVSQIGFFFFFFLGFRRLHVSTTSLFGLYRT